MSFIISPQSPIRPATYIIYKDGSTYRAINGFKGSQYTSGSDAATVINAALSDTYTTYGGGTVHLKPATYAITTPIVMISRTVIEGENPSGLGVSNANTLLQLSTNANCDIINSYNAASTQSFNCTVKDIALDGNKSNQNGAGPYNGIGFSVQEGRVMNTLIYGVKGRGIKAPLLSGTNHVYFFVDDSRTYNCDSAGIYFDYWSVNFRVSRCIVDVCGKTNSEAGIITNGPYNFITDCPQIYDCYQGIAVNGNQSGIGTFIQRNQIELIQREGVYITDSPDCKIEDNGFLQCSQATHNTYSSIYLNGNGNQLTGTVISGNVFRKADTNNDTSKYPKYNIDGTNEDYNLVFGNTFRNGATTGTENLTGANDIVTANIV